MDLVRAVLRLRILDTIKFYLNSSRNICILYIQQFTVYLFVCGFDEPKLHDAQKPSNFRWLVAHGKVARSPKWPVPLGKTLRFQKKKSAETTLHLP